MVVRHHNVYRWQMQQPAILEALFDALLEWEMMRTEFVLDAGADVLVHMAWYEGTTFWTPKSFRRFIKPRLAQIVHLCHARAFRYATSSPRSGNPFRRICSK